MIKILSQTGRGETESRAELNEQYTCILELDGCDSNSIGKNSLKAIGNDVKFCNTPALAQTAVRLSDINITFSIIRATIIAVTRARWRLALSLINDSSPIFLSVPISLNSSY